VAIILRGKSKCPICGDVIGKEDELVSTSHFIQDRTDPLWRFSDAGMHRQCFLAWQHRSEFVERFNSLVGPSVSGGGTRRRMHDDGSITVEPAE